MLLEYFESDVYRFPGGGSWSGGVIRGGKKEKKPIFKVKHDMIHIDIYLQAMVEEFKFHIYPH